MTDLSPEKSNRDHQPAFNVPGALLMLIGILIAIHVWRSFVHGLWTVGDLDVLRMFALVPARVGVAFGLINLDALLAGTSPADLPLKSRLIAVFVLNQDAGLWTFFTSAFLHGGTEHLVLNSVWLAIFGTPVIRRFGTLRFALLFIAGAVGGSLLFYALKPYDVTVLVGASGAISGLTAATMRFCFSNDGFVANATSNTQPALSLKATFTQRSSVTFLIVWFGINLVMGLLGPALPGGNDIAWQAHLGGCIAGLLAFGVLDPYSNRTK